MVPRPARAGSGRCRRYGAADVERIAFLRRARDLGFSLAEVWEFLAFTDGDPAQSCQDVDQMAWAHLAQVDAKIARLTALRGALAGVIDQCRGGLAVADCRIPGALGGARRIHGADSAKQRESVQTATGLAARLRGQLRFVICNG